jgi:hypothetical protein
LVVPWFAVPPGACGGALRPSCGSSTSLAWAAVEPREQFAIDLPPALLVRALAHLQERSEHAVGEHLNAPDDSLEIAQRAVQVLAACRGAFEQLADQRATRMG